jgi:hypothetical protein
MDYPGRDDHIDIPNWLYYEINKDGFHYDIEEWGKGFSPNYNNKTLIKYHKKLMYELGKRYNNDSGIFIICLGSIGHWGEWHTSKIYKNSFPSVNITNQYLQDYIDNFPDKFKSIRRPFQLAKENSFGLHNNALGNENQTYNYFVDFFKNGYTDHLTGEKHPSMPDFWKSAPSGGELGYYPSTQFLTDDKIDETINQFKKSHTSWFFSSTESRAIDNMQKLLNNTGYRFTINSVQYTKNVYKGNILFFNFQIENKGSAPFYFNWPIELSLINSSGDIIYKKNIDYDIRSILPGTKDVSANIKIPRHIPDGTYTLAIAILDPKTNLPSISLALNNKRIDNRYNLVSINILNNNK